MRSSISISLETYEELNQVSQDLNQQKDLRNGKNIIST